MFDSASNDGHKAPVERDRWGRYLLPRPSDPSGKVVSWQRATTLTKMASDMNGIMKWKMRYVAKGVATQQHLYAMAAATDLNDKNSFDKLTESAFEAAGGNSAASTGTALHSFSEQVDEGLSPDVPDIWKPDIEAYKKLVRVNGLEFPKEGIERIVVNEALQVAGTFDRIARLTKPLRVKVGDEYVNLKKGDWVVLDLKTGKDLSYGWRDIAAQLATYAYADAMWNPVTKQFESLPALNRMVALVIHLPAGTGQATLYGVDIQRGIEAAHLCATIRDWRKVKDLASMVGQPVAEDPFDSEYDIDPVMLRVMSANSKEELNSLYLEYSPQGLWNDSHLTAGRIRLEQLNS